MDNNMVLLLVKHMMKDRKIFGMMLSIRKEIIGPITLVSELIKLMDLRIPLIFILHIQQDSHGSF